MPDNIVDIMCPDCRNRLRIDIDAVPGHCHYCGRLLRYDKKKQRIEPGYGEETDIIETQYSFLKKKQSFGAKDDSFM